MARGTYFSGFFLLLALYTVCHAELSFHAEADHVMEGQDIVLTCKNSESLKLGIGENMHFAKRQAGDDSVAEFIRLTVGNINIDSTYTGRAKAEPIADQDGHALGYSLTITGAIPQDTAEYGCAVSTGIAQLDAFEWRNVYVKRQIDDLQMFAVAPNGTEIPLENQKAYQLTKKEDLRLMCRASGSVPAAKINAYLGVQDITGQLFHETVEKIRTPGATAHMATYSFTTTLVSNNSFEVLVPQTIGCSATVEGMEGSKTFEIFTFFKHAPVIHCNRTVSHEMKEDVKLNCYASADPKIDKIHWVVRMPSGKNMTIDDTTKHTQYYARFQTAGNRTSTSLTISQVFLNHFSNEYFIYAENSEGSTQMEAILEKDPNAGGSTSSASTIAGSFGLLLLISATSLRLWRHL